MITKLPLLTSDRLEMNLKDVACYWVAAKEFKLSYHNMGIW